MNDYREYLRIPGVKPLLFASTFGRLAYAMVSLAIFFQVQSITGSVGTAGLAVGLSSGLGAMTAGPRGLIVDRFALNISPKLGIAAVGVSMLIGGLLLAFNSHSRGWVPEEREHGEAGLLRSPAIRFLAVEGAMMGLSAGFITIGIPALATLSGEEGMAGPVLSAMGVGAIIGTLWAGAKAKEIAPVNGLRASTLLFAIALLPLAFVPIGPWMMVVVLVAWAFIGPANVFYLEVIDLVRPRGTAVAALGTLWMIEGAGMAVGAALGGIIAESVNPHLTLALGSLFAIASPILFTIGMRGVLKPATRATAEQALEAATT